MNPTPFADCGELVILSCYDLCLDSLDPRYATAKFSIASVNFIIKAMSITIHFEHKFTIVTMRGK